MRINSFNNKIIMCDEDDLKILICSGNFNNEFITIHNYFADSKINRVHKGIYDEVAFHFDVDEVSKYVWEYYNSKQVEVIGPEFVVNAFMYAIENNDKTIEKVLRDIIKKREEKSVEKYIKKYGKTIVDYIIEHANYSFILNDNNGNIIDSDNKILLYENGRLKSVNVSDINDNYTYRFLPENHN